MVGVEDLHRGRAIVAVVAPSQGCEPDPGELRQYLDDLRAGGVPMLPIGSQPSADAALDPAFSEGNLMGKRYVDQHGAEVLVTKAGAGTLSIGQTPLTVKDAKPLPASD